MTPWTIVPSEFWILRAPELDVQRLVKIVFKAFLMPFLSLNDGIFAKSEKYIYEQFTIAIPHCYFHLSHVRDYFEFQFNPISKQNDQKLVLEYLNSDFCMFILLRDLFKV